MPTFVRGQPMVVGMVHVGALPGTPGARLPVAELANAAVAEAEIYRGAGLDAVMIENMHDRPYLKGTAGPEVVAAMTRVATEVKHATDLPCGIQILAGANLEALAVAQAADLDFVRAEGFVFAHVADEGIIEASAGELLRYRKQIGADDVQVLADIKKKHSSHSLTEDTDIGETAKAAEFFLADGIVVTGSATGVEASLEEISQVRRATSLPVVVGSGVTPENVGRYLERADAVIVGSSLKEEGRWQNPVCGQRVAALMGALGR